MVSTKKRLELLFKAECQLEKVTEKAVKEHLKTLIKGISIRSVDLYPKTEATKAVVSSNLMALLTGSASAEEPTASVQSLSLSKTALFVGSLTSLPGTSTSIELEIKERELAEQGKELTRARKEVLDLRAELERTRQELMSLSKKCEELSKREGEDVAALFQQQIMQMSRKIEQLDNEKTKAEKDKKAYQEQVLEFQQKLQIRAEVKTHSASKRRLEESARGQVESMEYLMVQKQKLFEEEKKNLQENIAQMGLKMLAEKERASNFEAKAMQYDKLQALIAKLTTENEQLNVQLRDKTQLLASSQQDQQQNQQQAADLIHKHPFQISGLFLFPTLSIIL